MVQMVIWNDQSKKLEYFFIMVLILNSTNELNLYKNLIQLKIISSSWIFGRDFNWLR